MANKFFTCGFCGGYLGWKENKSIKKTNPCIVFCCKCRSLGFLPSKSIVGYAINNQFKGWVFPVQKDL